MTEPFLPSDAALDLTRAIQARTSGSPCGRLRAIACDLVDGTIDPTQGRLAQAHMEGCAACAGLVAALRSSQEVLPALVHANPGPWFTQRLLRATTHQTARPSLWWKLMHRPRIALEAAYLGAAASLMGSYLPLPTPHLTQKVPALIQPLGASAQRVAGQLAQVERRTTGSLRQALLPQAPPSAVALPAKSLWQRASARVRAWLRFSPERPAETNRPKPANP